MQDFAALLLDARNRAGLTQAQVAVAAGLTPSYLSFIENRKKPPPSDEVCRRLAKVLSLPEKRVLEVAHMERAPEALQKKVKTLTHSLKRERRSRRRALESLLSPFLFRGPPGWLEASLDKPGISASRQKRIRQVLAAVGRRNIDREKQVSKIVDELPERERTLLLEMLPELLGRTDTPPARSAGRNAKAKAASPTAPAAPELPYSLPDPDAGIEEPFLLEATREAAAAIADIDPGDLLLVDPAAQPGLGDIAVLRGKRGYLLRRLKALGDGFLLALDPGDADEKQLAVDKLDAKALSARLRKVGAGAVIEIRRPLRRRPAAYD
jgi:transcriptional regulator with XRE-family HTH domain